MIRAEDRSFHTHDYVYAGWRALDDASAGGLHAFDVDAHLSRFAYLGRRLNGSRFADYLHRHCTDAGLCLSPDNVHLSWEPQWATTDSARNGESLHSGWRFNRLHRLESSAATIHGEQRPASTPILASTVLELESADEFAFLGRILSVAGVGAPTAAVLRSQGGGARSYGPLITHLDGGHML